MFCNTLAKTKKLTTPTTLPQGPAWPGGLPRLSARRHVLQSTSRANLTCGRRYCWDHRQPPHIGHSQGTIQAFAALSEGWVSNEKVWLIVHYQKGQSSQGRLSYISAHGWHKILYNYNILKNKMHHIK